MYVKIKLAIEDSSLDRRNFLKWSSQSSVSILGSSVVIGLTGKWLSNKPDSRKWPYNPPVLRPPGAGREEEFLSVCIRCQRCEEACVPEAIKLAGPHDPTQKGTPYILPSDNACTLCLACTKACPTGALKPIEDKKKVKMGLAKVNETTCVSHNGTGFCGACFTACPLHGKALTLNRKNAPQVHEDHCVGCGLCEEACILKETKAIRVFSDREVS